ncbi:MAG: ArsR/SmtB family transcription factor [Acidimicrobiales bacterium]
MARGPRKTVPLHLSEPPPANLREELEELTSTMCRALNDPNRLGVLYALAAGPHSVNELCELLDVPQSNLSQHLSVLRDRGLVDTEREGDRVIYALRDRRVLEAVDLLRAVMNDELARRHALRQAL